MRLFLRVGLLMVSIYDIKFFDFRFFPLFSDVLKLLRTEISEKPVRV